MTLKLKLAELQRELESRLMKMETEHENNIELMMLQHQENIARIEAGQDQFSFYWTCRQEVDNWLVTSVELTLKGSTKLPSRLCWWSKKGRVPMMSVMPGFHYPS